MIENAVWLEFTTLDSWLRVRTKKKDLKCSKCKGVYITIGKPIALMTEDIKVGNLHICDDCGRKYIEKGYLDVKRKRDMALNERQQLVDKIIESKVGGWTLDGRWNSLKDKDMDQLKKIWSNIEKVLEEQRLIEEDKLNYVPTSTEEYLVKEYGVYEHADLKSPLQFEEWFKEEYYDHFDCGQGYAQEKAVLLVKVGNKFYFVTLTAEIGSAKQDRGDRLYWVEKLSSVSYEETAKPQPKERIEYKLELSLTPDQKNALESFIKTQGLS
jgi:hypothetical protein